VLSHLIQHPPGWFGWPSRPVQLYRVNQGVHVATGLATIPLLAAKLWYDPMPFFFPAAHYWTAWVAVGAILVHVGVKLPVIREALGHAAPEPAGSRGLTRRGFIGGVAAAAGVITVSMLGQTVAPLSPLSLLAPRRPGTGPQRLPVNQSAAAAGVVARARDPGYRLELVGPARSVRLALADLAALPQHTERLPIACVEGWSADATWTGVRLRELAALVEVGVDAGGPVEAYVESLQAGGAWRSSTVAPPHLRDPLTLLALRIHGEPLHLDHGYPGRLIAPNRPGVMQTKWVARITFRDAA
jgi:hypothetical protein